MPDILQLEFKAKNISSWCWCFCGWCWCFCVAGVDVFVLLVLMFLCGWRWCFCMAGVDVFVWLVLMFLCACCQCFCLSCVNIFVCLVFQYFCLAVSPCFCFAGISMFFLAGFSMFLLCSALRIITKLGFNAHTNPLFKELKILKLEDHTTLLNCFFIHDYFNKRLPKSFDNTFVKLDEMTSINTRNSTLGCIFIPSVNSTKYGLNSIIRKSIVSWDTMHRNSKMRT